MINKRILLIDIETTTIVEYVEELNINLLRQFQKIYEKNIDKYKSMQEAFQNEAPFHPEFSQVICVSVGYINGNDTKITNFNIREDSEKLVLIKLRELFNKAIEKDYYLCGNNIKGFDIPFLGKRYLINNLIPPQHFPNYDTKPWDLKIIDIKDIWTFGKFGSLFNTDLICSSMNIPTPKDNMNGSMVYEKFYNKEIEEIINYCNKDVESLINLIKKFKDFE